MMKMHWVIVGGESGPGARPFNIQWARTVIAQAKAAAVPVFVKQLGVLPYEYVDGNAHYEGDLRSFRIATHHLDALTTGLRNGRFINTIAVDAITDRKGAAIQEWPADLRVRQFLDDWRRA
jgi:hypothetical protein